MHLSIRARLFLSHLLVVMLVAGGAGAYLYFNALDNLIGSIQSRLLNSAALLSRSVSAVELEGIRQAADSERPEYRRILQALRAYANSNPDIAYIYLMRQESGQILFVVDSDTSRGQALPGQPYAHATPALWEGFKYPAVDKDLASDEWGSFLSGFAPLADGGGAYLVGVDMRADTVRSHLHNLQWAWALASIAALGLALVCSRLLARHFCRPLGLLMARCQEIAAGQLEGRLDMRTHDADLDRLLETFNQMSARLQENRTYLESTRAALRESRGQLERRVAQRTAELERLNRYLLQEVQERRRAQDALRQSTRNDPLTGLLNRQAMMELLSYEVKRAGREHTPFSLVLMDIDHFRRINQEHGHAVGDQVLIQLADILRYQLRAQDAVARWGGEEILLLLPNTVAQGALLVAEKIRSQVESLVIRVQSLQIKITLSLGVGEFSGAGDVEDCIQGADMAMYRAKRAGRNTVMTENRPLYPVS